MLKERCHDLRRPAVSERAQVFLSQEESEGRRKELANSPGDTTNLPHTAAGGTENNSVSVQTPARHRLG